MSKIEDNYFNWMYDLVSDCSALKKRSFRRLLMKLHDMEFSYMIPMDVNRAEDGIDLRYRYGYENNVSRPVISSSLDIGPCSVLEMMIALAIRCEEQIMDNPDIGNRTSHWFWGMIKNLGLDGMDDTRYDRNLVEKSIHICLERNYRKNGEGGLFVIRDSDVDMRSMEIWYQMMWFLDEILQN